MDIVKTRFILASQDCAACAFGDGIAVLDLKSNQYFTLNPVAAAVWSGIEKGASEDDLVDRVLADFAVDRATCAQDVADLIDTLARAGLVSVR